MSQTSGPRFHAPLLAQRASACALTPESALFFAGARLRAAMCIAALSARLSGALTAFSLVLVLLVAGPQATAPAYAKLLVPQKHIALLSLGLRATLRGAMTWLNLH